MPVGLLETDVRQLFSYSVLERLERRLEAGVRYTFDAGSLYLSCFSEGMRRLEQREFLEADPDLLRFARVFERFAALAFAGIDRSSALQMSGAFYWLAGYTANATVVGKHLLRSLNAPNSLQRVLATILGRGDALRDELRASSADRIIGRGDAILGPLAHYLWTGDEAFADTAQQQVERDLLHAGTVGDAAEFVAGQLLSHVLRRLRGISLWGTLRGHATAGAQAWSNYALVQIQLDAPLIDLWPSQRTAIRKGLLDAESSLVLQMPTSAGKTKMTELAFVNDLFTDDRRCLYLAPFRALVGEIEASLGPTLSQLQVSVASLYGGAEANEIEVELSQRARVVIGTPEKIAAVLRMSGGRLTDYRTIVLDEGHLLGNSTRGAAFELQLAALRSEVLSRAAGVVAPRVLFLSAVLPNAYTVARWLGGSADALATDDWQPTAMRVGLLTWESADEFARITYIAQPRMAEEEAFFVPRVLREDRWEEVNAVTGRKRTHRFPAKSDKGSVCAALGFQYAKYGPVIVYAAQPRWADGIAQRMLDRIADPRPIQTNLRRRSNRTALEDLADYVAQRLGTDSIAARALRFGIGIHHGGIPITVRLAIEDAFRSQVLRLLLATNTVSQGVNFPVKTVIVHSLPSGDAPVREFWNLAGRAGRAMRETDGEVIVVASGAITFSARRNLRRALFKEGLEAADSQILRFVRRVLELYPQITPDAIETLTTDEAEEEWDLWRRVVAAIDTQLLELMVEDLADVESAQIEELVANLLATEQLAEEPGSEAEREALSQLFRLREEALRELVPSVETRRRYARTGISARGAVLMDDDVPSLKILLQGTLAIEPEALAQLITTACRVPELREIEPTDATLLALAWIRNGSYADVLNAVPERFASLDETVHFVEQTLAYSLPWILNGLLRLLQPEQVSNEDTADLPEWVRYLPQFLRFGVQDVDLVWIMSLGIPDPAFARWIRDQYVSEYGRGPASFRSLVSWALDRHQELVEGAANWPPYFRRVLHEVLTRYAELSRVLGT